MELVDAVELYVRLVEEPHADGADLTEALMAQGVSEDDAARVVSFVPLAFGRLLLPLGKVEVVVRPNITGYEYFPLGAVRLYPVGKN